MVYYYLVDTCYGSSELYGEKAQGQDAQKNTFKRLLLVATDFWWRCAEGDKKNHPRLDF